MKLNLLQKHRFLRIPGRFAPLLEKSLTEGDYPVDGEINIVLTDDERIRRLNSEFMGRDRPTDVIAFGLEPDGDPHADGVCGEVYVSLDRAREQAGEAGHSFTREAIMLIIHGLFHLAGETDGTPAERRRMEDRVMSALRRLELKASGGRGRR